MENFSTNAERSGKVYFARFPNVGERSCDRYCLRHSVLGYSWTGLRTGHDTIDVARTEAKLFWPDGRRGANPTLTCFKEINESGGLILLKSNGSYYLGVATGEFQSNSAHSDAGIDHHIRVQYYGIPENRIPWSVRSVRLRRLIQPRYDEELVAAVWEIFYEYADASCVVNP